MENKYNDIEYCNGGIKPNDKPFIGELNKALKSVNDIRSYIAGYQKGLAVWQPRSQSEQRERELAISVLNGVADLLPKEGV